jgi:hypothetical protein
MRSIPLTIATLLILVVGLHMLNSMAQGGSPRVDLVGSIIKINRPPEGTSSVDRGLSLLIEGVLADGTPTEMLVNVTPQTHLFRKTAEGSQVESLDVLSPGQKVEVAFDGPVLMTYPLRARAAGITILPF